MAFNHRKLSTDPSNIDLSICLVFCNPAANKDGYCPASCISKCYPTCNRTLTSLIPPLDSNHPKKPTKIHLSLILSLSLLATICFLFSCYTIYKYYKNWQTTRSSSSRSSPNPDQDEFLDEDHGPTLDHPIWYIRTVGLQPSIINKITVCRYKRGEGLVEGTECSVCLSEFQEDETLRLLPKCNHAFHIPCIDTWLRSHTNCPMCRAGIAAASDVAVPVPPLLLPPPEQSGGDSPAPEENFELGTGIPEEDRELQVENGGISSFRRSVSLDSLSASRVFDDIARAYNTGESAGNSNSQVVSKVEIGPKKVEINRSLLRLVGGPSFGKSLQKGPVLMKRSFSCSANVLLSRYNRNRNSILPS